MQQEEHPSSLIRNFNPNEHLIHLKTGQTSKDYLPVQWRLVWFRALCPEGTIETEMLHLDLDCETEEESWAWNAQTRRNEKVVKHGKGFVVFKETVKDGRGGMATGTKSEKAASFPDFIEKAETGAIGRALAALGYGTQFAPEFEEENTAPPAGTASEEPSPSASSAPSSSLHDLLTQARERAKKLGLASTQEEWKKLLASLNISQLNTTTISRLHEHMNKVEATRAS
jgi:hypothetical protein